MSNTKNNNLFNFTQHKNIRSICDDFNQILNQIGQISKFKSDYNIIEKYLIELTNDLPHRLIALQGKFSGFTDGAKGATIKELFLKLTSQFSDDQEISEKFMKLKSRKIRDNTDFDDELVFLEMIEISKQYIENKLIITANKYATQNAEQALEEQNTLKELDLSETENELVVSIYKKYANRAPKKMITEDEKEEVLQFIKEYLEESKELEKDYQGILTNLDDIEENKKLISDHRKNIDIKTNQLNSLKLDLEHLNIKHKILSKQLDVLNRIDLNDLDKSYEAAKKSHEIALMELEIRSQNNAIRTIESEIAELQNKSTQLITSSHIREQLIKFIQSKEKGRNERISELQNFIEILEKQQDIDPEQFQSICRKLIVDYVQSEYEKIIQNEDIMEKINSAAIKIAELTNIFSLKQDSHNKGNIDEFVARTVCGEENPQTLLELRNTAIIHTINILLDKTKENLKILFSDSILEDIIEENIKADKEKIQQETIERIDADQQKKIIDMISLVEEFLQSAQDTSSDEEFIELSRLKRQLETEITNILDISSICNDLQYDHNAHFFDVTEEFKNCKSHQDFNHILGEVEQKVLEHLEVAKLMCNNIIETLSTSKEYDKKDKILEDDLIKLSNELPHKLEPISLGAKSFF